MEPISRLQGVHPDLARKVQQILSAMHALGFSMVVTDGLRTVAEQQALYAKGRNAAGQVVDQHAIVTNADGVVTRSNHQAHADGFGHAVDCTFLDDHGTPLDPSDDRPIWRDRDPWLLYGTMAETLGLKWGGRWKRPFDRPHVELP